MKIEWIKDIDFSKGLVVDKMAENDSAKEMRILLPKNVEMREHKAPKPIVVQVLSGEIIFTAKGESENYFAGDMVLLESNILHSLAAIEDSVIRLTLHKNDSEDRPKSVPLGVLKT